MSPKEGSTQEQRGVMNGAEVSARVAQAVKILPATEGDARDSGQSLGREDSPGGGNDTHSSILAQKTPWTEEPCGL